uniref:Uncharacterized protein n=1 Tax=Moniliophthora roreri TaxID=221103 RepID=A0A0W0FSG6_MONRR
MVQARYVYHLPGQLEKGYWSEVVEAMLVSKEESVILAAISFILIFRTTLSNINFLEYHASDNGATSKVRGLLS